MRPDLAAALSVLKTDPRAAPAEPNGLWLLQAGDARRRWLDNRDRLRKRNGWPRREALCECGRIFPPERVGVRRCEDCRK